MNMEDTVPIELTMPPLAMFTAALPPLHPIVNTCIVCALLLVTIASVTALRSSPRRWMERDVDEWFAVNKSWCRHHYLLGMLSTCFGLALPVDDFVYGVHAQSIYRPKIDGSTHAFTCTLILTLMSVHCARRLFESLAVSVYGSSRVHLLLYVLGIVQYVTLPLVVLVDARAVKKSFLPPLPSSITDAYTKGYVRLLVGLLLFVWASAKHSACLRRLAVFRRNDKGEVTTTAHGIVFDDWWFCRVACPHLLFDVLIYASWSIMAGVGHYPLRALLLYVVVQAACSAMATHRWYSQQWREQYPNERKRIIPYIF